MNTYLLQSDLLLHALDTGVPLGGFVLERFRHLRSESDPTHRQHPHHPWYLLEASPFGFRGSDFVGEILALLSQVDAVFGLELAFVLVRLLRLFYHESEEIMHAEVATHPPWSPAGA